MSSHPSFELDWNLLRTFFAVARTGSLAGGATQIGITHPTAARHIQLLEERLEMSLFTRTPRGLKLNGAGQRLQRCAESMHRGALAVEAVCDELRATPVRHLRIATEQLLAGLLPSVVLQELRNDKQVSIDLVVTDEDVDLISRDADIALKTRRPEQQDLLVRCVGELELGLYTAPVECGSTSQEMGEEIEKLPLVDDLGHNQFGAPERTEFKSDYLSGRIAAVRSGWGVGVFPKSCPEVRDLTCLKHAGTLQVWLAARPEVRDSRHLTDAFRNFGDAVRKCLEPA